MDLAAHSTYGESAEIHGRKPDLNIKPRLPRTSPEKKKRNPLPLIVILALVGAGGFIAWRSLGQRNTLPEGVLPLSGRIDGDDSAVAPKTTGKIMEIRYREGDVVKAGDIIAVLDDAQVRAREEEARASVAQSAARLDSARQQTAVLNDQLRAAEIQTVQSKTDTEGRVRQAEAELASAEAKLKQQESSYQLAVFDRDAYSALVKTGAASERQAKQAETTADAQEAVVASSRRKVEAARGSLRAAQATMDNPSIRIAQSAAIRKQVAQQNAEIASAAADEDRARHSLTEAQANRADLTVRAPFDGTIVTRTAEPGEVVSAGTPIVTLLDLHKVYLRGFVPEGEIGKVKIGQRAHVFLDSDPNKPLDAYVSRIDPQATFTPENTYFRDDRVKQVVGLKLQLETGFGYAKPGMPADGEILVSGGTWPETKREK
jgi:HlyD family secretion protein